MKTATFLAISGPLGCNSLMKKELEGYFCENYSIIIYFASFYCLQTYSIKNTNVILSEKKKGI